MFTDYQPIVLDPEVQAHVNQIVVSCSGFDDVAILMCKREECMVDYQFLPVTKPRKVWWTAEIDGMSIEQVIEQRHLHLREHHRRARLVRLDPNR